MLRPAFPHPFATAQQPPHREIGLKEKVSAASIVYGHSLLAIFTSDRNPETTLAAQTFNL